MFICKCPHDYYYVVTVDARVGHSYDLVPRSSQRISVHDDVQVANSELSIACVLVASSFQDADPALSSMVPI